MSDRTVHAATENWEVVRYDRAGKWYVEWVGAPGQHPGTIGPEYLLIRVNNNGRAAVDIHDAVTAAIGLGCVHYSGRPGGLAFDRKFEERS